MRKRRDTGIVGAVVDTATGVISDVTRVIAPKEVVQSVKRTGRSLMKPLNPRRYHTTRKAFGKLSRRTKTSFTKRTRSARRTTRGMARRTKART